MEIIRSSSRVDLQINRSHTVVALVMSCWSAAVAFAVAPQAYNNFDPLQHLVLVGGALPLAGVCLAGLFAHRHNPDSGISFWLLVPLFLVFLSLLQKFSGLQANQVMNGSGWWTALTIAALVPMIMSDRERLLFLRGWIVVAAVQALVVVLQAVGLDPLFLFMGRFEGIWRVYGTLGNPNLVACLLVPVTLLGLDQKLVPAAGLRILLLCLLGVATVLTGSRTAALVLAGGLVLSMVQQKDVHPPFGRKVLVIAAIGITPLTFVVAVMMGKGFTSPEGRLFFWDAAIRLIAERPVTGYGWAGFQTAYLHALDLVGSNGLIPEALPIHPDNDWLEFGVELGIFGLLPFACVLGLLWRSWQRAVARPLSVALGSLVLLSLVYSPLHTPATALLFWGLFGTLTGMAGKGIRHTYPVPFLLAGCLVILVAALPVQWDRLMGNFRAVQAEQVEADKEGEAAAIWQQAWQQAPSEGEFAFRAAYILARQGKYGEALRWVDRSMQTWSSINALTLQAWLLASLGRVEEARVRLEWLQDKFPRLDRPKELRESLQR